MANLPATNPGLIQVEETRFKAAVSEYLAQKIGRAINYILNFGLSTVEFNTPGSHSWTAPTGVYRVQVTMIGGGGGGGSGAVGGTFTGGGGGSGAVPFSSWVTVIPGNIYPITVGAGGSGGAPSSGADGTDGGSSLAFGLTALGGLKGLGGTTSGVAGLGGGGAPYNGRGYRTFGGAGNQAGINGSPGEASFYADGGPAFPPPSGTFAGGGGGGAGFDAGGSGQTVISGTRGSGGGGSLGTNVGATAAGGNGGNGVVILTWFGNA